jgi:hypothetical protein
MTTLHSQPTRRVLMAGLCALVLGACAEDTVAPEAADGSAQFAQKPQTDALKPQAELNRALATLRRVTAAYHDIQAAFDDGFVLLHPCEERPDEGPVGTVYVHMGRLLDGVIDPELPEALIYEPTGRGERLVGVEFAMPYALWNEPEPPEFLGNVFQPEDEFGVYALHAWVWRHNPEGMFAESNPHVTCGAD